MPTVLITGCSSGFGLDTARLFLDRGRTVVATMRKPRSDVAEGAGPLLGGGDERHLGDYARL